MVDGASIKTDHNADGGMPRRLKIGLLGALFLAGAGAAWLVWARGTALLIDLGAAAGGLFCF